MAPAGDPGYGSGMDDAPPAAAEAAAEATAETAAETAGEVAAETAAVYLARALVADLGFHPGTLAEAAALAAACDLVLTGSDGNRLIIACVVDRDAHPERRFGLEPAQVEEAAAACRDQARGALGGRAPVVIEVWEVGAGVPDAADRERLEALAFHRPARPGLAIEAIAVDSQTARTVSTLTGVPRLERAAWVERTLTGPRRDLRGARPARPLPIASGRPRATLSLLAVLAVVFVLELVLAPVPSSGFLSPHWSSLAAMGGSEHNRVVDGELWRLLTAAFLHGGLEHLAFNGVALFMVGGVLEHMMGRVWMLALFVLGAVGGSLMSIQLNDPGVVSVGASGAIIGMMAAALLLSMRLPRGQARRSLRIVLAYMLIPALLPLATHESGQTIDYANHLGGAITGGAVGLVLLITWPRDAVRPRGVALAWAVIAAGALVLAAGVIGIARGWSEEVSAATAAETTTGSPGRSYQHLLVPNETMPRTEAAWREQLPGLGRRYPRDPRVRVLTAEDAVEHDDWITARNQLEAAIADIEIIHTHFPSGDLEKRLRADLALVHLQLDDRRRARQVIEPMCGEADVRTVTDLDALCTELSSPPPPPPPPSP